MSTGPIYHGFEIRGYHYLRTEYVGGEIHVTIRQPRDKLRCAVCGARGVVRRGERPRRFRGLPIGKKRVWLYFAVPRVECRRCGMVRQATVSFADGQRHYTRAFERYVLEPSQHMTMGDVAIHLGVSAKLVKEIVKRHLKRRFIRPRLKDLRRLAIDEISIVRGHRYVTVVLDLETGAVGSVGEGKGAAALDPFWRRLRASRVRIEAVAIDMSKAYSDGPASACRAGPGGAGDGALAAQAREGDPPLGPREPTRVQRVVATRPCKNAPAGW